MPASLSNFSSSSARSSLSPRRGKGRQYHKVSNKSEVDETLFGSNAHSHVRKTCNDNCSNNIPGGLRYTDKTDKDDTARRPPKPEALTLISNDYIRQLKVPVTDPSGRSIVLFRQELDYLKEKARVVTLEEREEKAKAWREKIIQNMEELNDRREYMKMKDQQRVKNEVLNDIEMQEFWEQEEMRNLAFGKIEEREEEIKKLNELINHAKCHVIRDAQLLEKEEIKKKKQEEEDRLNRMLEINRLKGMAEEEELERKRQNEAKHGAMQIMKQIRDNQDNRLLDLERKDQENILMRKYVEKLCEEELAMLEAKKEKKKKLREDLDECNQDILRQKEMVKIQEKVLEDKVLEFQKNKEEREIALEKMQEKIRKDKEKETARLLAAQERARDEQSQRDELRAKRAQEQAEREWRKKEAYEAKKKKETNDMLFAAREKQQKWKESFQAIKAQRDREEFERLLKLQQEAIIKDREEEISKKNKNRMYSQDIRHQIVEKEKKRVEQRKAFFEEGVKLDEEAKQRRIEIEAIKQKKLDALRATGVGEKYLAQIKRKVIRPVEQKS